MYCNGKIWLLKSFALPNNVNNKYPKNDLTKIIMINVGSTPAQEFSKKIKILNLSIIRCILLFSIFV